MLNPAIVSVSSTQFNAAEPVIAERDVTNVFKVFMGFYGVNLFLSKFGSGTMTDVKGAAPNAQGVKPQEDAGVANARWIWAHGLRRYSAVTIKAALDLCQVKHLEYPPSLPQFVALCAACRPREVFQSASMIGMDGTLRSRYAREARAINIRHAQRAASRETGRMVAPTPGLDGLKQAIACAVGDAGGNEAATLLQMDRMFLRGAA